VRAAVASADGKHTANVIGYVDLPDVARQELALSGIVVKNGGAATVEREFGVSAAVGLSFQVARATKTPAPVSVHYSLRDELGQAVANIDVPHERAVPGAAGIESYDIGVRLPASPGRYVVTIEATAGHHSVHRSVPITVR